MNAVVHYLNYIRDCIHSKADLRCVTKVYVELIQNIQFYSFEKTEDGKGVGTFNLNLSDSFYILTFKNLVNNEQKEILERIFIKLSESDLESLNNQKMSALRKPGFDSPSIGLISVFKESDNLPYYNFLETNDNNYIYSIELKIKQNG